MYDATFNMYYETEKVSLHKKKIHISFFEACFLILIFIVWNYCILRIY